MYQKTRDFVSKTRNFALKMMKSAAAEGPPNAGQSFYQNEDHSIGNEGFSIENEDSSIEK